MHTRTMARAAALAAIAASGSAAATHALAQSVTLEKVIGEEDTLPNG